MFRQVILAIAFVSLLTAGSKLPQQVFNISKGSIAILSDAPLELIKAASTELKGKLDAAKKLFAFTIKISSFKGFNSPLQKEHFNENYLESGKYPDAFFKGKIIEEVDFGKDGTYTVRAKGKLNIHGVEQDRIIKSSMTIKNGQITIKSNFTVQLADHNIPIPKVVHEKLASEINVEVNAVLAGE
jgi:polyisoprenoid-binding protein YceI